MSMRHHTTTTTTTNTGYVKRDHMVHLDAHDRTYHYSAEFLKTGTIFSTFMLSCSFIVFSLYTINDYPQVPAPTENGNPINPSSGVIDRNLYQDFTHSLFIACIMFLCTSVWNVMGYLMVGWMAGRMERRMSLANPTGRFFHTVILFTSILFMFAGIGAFMAALYFRADINEELLSLYDIEPEVIALPATLFFVLVCLFFAGFFINMLDPTRVIVNPMYSGVGANPMYAKSVDMASITTAPGSAEPSLTTNFPVKEQTEMKEYQQVARV